MKNSKIAQKSAFGEIIQSFANPKLTTFKETGITPEVLKKLHYFKSFSFDEINDFLKYTNLIQAPNKCKMIVEGEENSPFYFVIRGAIQSNITEDNKVAKLAVLGPASLFGNNSFIDNTSSLISYISCERCILLKIPASELDLLQKNNINLWHKTYDIICKSFILLEKSAEKLYIRLNIELYNR